MQTNRSNPMAPLGERTLKSTLFSNRWRPHMSSSGKYRAGSSASQLQTWVTLGCASLALLVIVLGALYYSSPYFATDPVVARLANKTLSAAATDGEMRSISANLYTALDQVVPGGQSDQPTSVLAQVSRAVVQEVRGQLLAEASRRMSSREGIDLAVYGWQGFAEHRVTLQRQYLEFPGLFSVVMVDATDGLPLTELVFSRSGFGDWNMVAVRPHWMRSQGAAILRQIVQAGIQKVMQPSQAGSKP